MNLSLSRFIRKIAISWLSIIVVLSLAGCGNLGNFGTLLSSQQPLPNNVYPQRIALLVPLQGPLANSGKAIRDSFFAAYYYNKAQYSQSPDIRVIDTSQGNIVDLYHQAVAAGAQLVVGPLEKPKVAELAAAGLSVPTIALNSLPGNHPQAVTNLYQFSLSSLDEAGQAADKAANDGFKHALIIAPNSEWGQTVTANFIREWQKRGGNVTDQANYQDQTNLDLQIRRLLSNDPNQLNPGVRRQNFTQNEIRHDADMIFIVATPTYARQIQPFLKYYWADNIPAYSTSESYGQALNPQINQDLNGLRIPVLPWLLDTQGGTDGALYPIGQHIMQTWPDDYAQRPLLYALGADAYSVIPQLNRMKANPQYTVAGALGSLSLNSYQQITRQMPWAQIQDGQLRYLP